ncbi:MAG: hypothetical protein JW836_15295 [Deltaproteobacteria bacterium]|nr:hypothetical protein [Deltaproteobacteria bacterium]
MNEVLVKMKSRKVISFPKQKKIPPTYTFKDAIMPFSAILEEAIKRELNKKATRKKEGPPEEDEA